MAKLNLIRMACIFVFCAGTVIALPAQTFTTLVSFDGTNGAAPVNASLVQGTDGNYYGTTIYGGANNDGTVFKMTPGGTLTTLHSFAGYPTDGAEPYAGLVQSAGGDFYGTTSLGGGNNYGTVFEMTPSGKLTTLLSFDSTDGTYPYSALVQANGSFYGTTFYGGAHGYGTVFKISAAGVLSTLHSFDVTDGESPWAGLTQAANGNFYGTTSLGGGNNYGTFFEMTPSGTLTTLYSFCLQGGGCADGEFPYSTPIQGADGNFYGTAPVGGDLTCNAPDGCGTVFKITPTGTLTVLHSFEVNDGAFPFTGLVQGTDRNLYGVTSDGGPNGLNGYGGTVFQISTAGTLTTLYDFCIQGCTDGDHPESALIQGTNGTFYGVTPDAGANNDGTVFSVSMGLGPFVEIQPTSGKAGAKVTILGNDLTGTTSVTFNGIAATFTVVKSSEITATVPTGATTGTVEVATPKKTLKSNVAFRVRP